MFSDHFSDSVFNWATPSNSSGIDRSNFHLTSFHCSPAAAPILSSHHTGQVHWRPAHFSGAGSFRASGDGWQQQHGGRPARRISPPSSSLPPPSPPPRKSSSSARGLCGSLQSQLCVGLTVTWPSACPASLLFSQC